MYMNYAWMIALLYVVETLQIFWVEVDEHNEFFFCNLILDELKDFFCNFILYELNEFFIGNLNWKDLNLSSSFII